VKKSNRNRNWDGCYLHTFYMKFYSTLLYEKECRYQDVLKIPIKSLKVPATSSLLIVHQPSKATTANDPFATFHIALNGASLRHSSLLNLFEGMNQGTSLLFLCGLVIGRTYTELPRSELIVEIWDML
jgi:hypothetical protein